MKKTLLFIAFIMMTFIINAQSGCNVFITSSFDSKCVLTDEKDNILIENGEAMLACKESTVIYSAISPDAVLYQWTIIGQSSYSTNGNTVTINWSNGNVGKVTVQITTSNGQTCDATKDIFLIEKPQIGSSSIPSYRWENGIKVIEICLGETIVFTNESATSNTDLTGHYWNSIYSTASSENYTIENVMQETKVYHKIINNCGCDDEETYEIRIMGGEKLELSCYGTVCENTTVTYEALNANCSDYNWFVEGGQIVSGQHSPKITIQWGSTDCGYGVLGLDGGLCDNFCKKLMSVKIPIITNNAKIKGQEIACVDEVALYSLTLWGSTEYTWTITPSQGVIQSHYDNANQTLLTFNSPGTYQLNVTYKCDFLDCGPFTSQTKTIVVNPKLKIDSENEKICLGQAATFTLNNNNINATWRVYNANNQQVYTSQTNSLVYTPTLSGKYKVTAEHANYCNVAEFLLNVKNPPPAPTGANISGKHYTCPNTSILLTGTPESAFYSLVWKSLCSTPTIEGTGNEFTASYSGNGCNVEVYHYDKEVGCLSTTPYIYQIQDFNLAATTLPTSGITVCAESTIEYINDEVPNQSPDVLYEWKISPEYAATVIGDKTQNNVSILVNTSTQPTFNIILERKYCTDSIATITIPVTIVSPPSAPTISPSPIPSVCVDTQVTLTGGSINSDNGYIWSIDNGSKIYNNLRIIGHTFTTAGTHNIQLSYQPYSVCPAAVTNTTINVIASPKFTLHDDNNGNVSVTPYDGANYTNYAWTQNGVSVNNTTGTFIGAQLNDEICCTVTNSAGCSETKCIRLIQQPGQNNPPCLPFNAISVNNICSDQSIRVIATNNPTVNPVKWTVLPNDTYTINSIDNNESKITFNSTGSYTVKGFVSDGSNCYKSNTLYIDVPVILDFDVEYNCSSPIGLKITDNSQYSVIQNRTFTITGGVAPVTMLSSERVKTQYVPLPTSGTVTYNITLTISGCTLTKSITLYPRITSASIIAPYSNQACQDVPLLLTVNSIPSSTPATSYTWNFGDGSSNSSSTNTIYHIFPVRPQPYLVGVNITDANNCVLTINPTISIKAITNNLSLGLLNRPGNLVCPGVQRDINYTPALTASTYLWHLTPPTNNISNYSTYKTGDYYVRVTSNIGCIGEAMINVPFKNKPTAFISGKTEYCQNDIVELFGDIGSNSSSLTYTWDITTPTTTLAQETTPNITFTASEIGTYIVDLTVDNGDCSDTYTHTFTVNATPLAPSISFVGNQCIDQPPVVLTANAPNGESIYWSSGVKSPTANYYSSGYALAYYYDQISGCKSKDGQILIASAPNFDALLTGCYKKCKYLLPSSLNVYNISKDYISWKWFFNSSSTTGSGNYLFSPLSLPLSGFGTYNLDVNYNSNICNVVSPSLVIEEEDCPCEEVDIKVTSEQVFKECRILYNVEVEICNNGSTEACFKELISVIDGIEILNVEFPSGISPGNCDKIIFTFEVHNPLSNFATFRIYDDCNKCYKEFRIDIKFEILDCEKEIELNDIDYHSEISNHNVSYFKFSLFLPSYPQTIFKIWSEPSQIIDFTFDPNNGNISGFVMFDRNLLAEMAERDEKVCFYIWMCSHDKIHQCYVCISARELLEKSGGAKSKPITPKDNDNQTSQSDKLYLVPNPASTYVKVEGIEQDNISELLLMDMTGKNLKKVQSTNTLNIQDVLKGTYILRVINKENKVYYLKLIKN